MPTLADYWRIKQRRDRASSPAVEVTFFEGPASPFDHDELE
jgi:hypothetical protein